MKTKICVFFLLIFIFISNDITSNNKQISLSPFPYLSQLPSNAVQRIFQDNEGFLWFGTLEGLCRYDGYNTLVFRSDINHPTLFPDNEITCIAEDNNMQLLIGTKQGLNILDKRNYQIRIFEGKELQNIEIKCITTASDGSIWIGTQRQLYRYDSNLSLIKKYDSSLPITTVSSILEDAHGDIWVCMWEQGIHKYDKKKDQFIRYPKIGKSNNPFIIFQDNNKHYWVGTWWDGLYKFNPNEENPDAMYQYQHIEGIDSSFENRFFSVTQDDKYGYLWFITNADIRALEYKDNKLHLVDTHHLFENYNNIFSQVIKDQEGNLWIASFTDGILTINFDKPVLQNYTFPEIKEATGFSPRISVIYEDNNECLWMNQERVGLTLYDTQKKQLNVYTEYKDLKDSLSLALVKYISGFRSLPDEIWIATDRSWNIFSMKRTKGQLILNKLINLRDYIPSSGKPRIFLEDNQDNIWIIASNSVLIKKKGKNTLEPVIAPINNIVSSTQTKDNSIWIGTLHNGIYQIKALKDSFYIKNYNYKNNNISSNNIKTICADNEDNIWIATKEGNILVFNTTEKQFQDYSQILNITNEGILNIIADDYNHLWFVTGKRIIEYNPETNTYRDYSEPDGVLVNTFLPNSCWKSNSGRLLFGGNKGITVFTPSSDFLPEPSNIQTLITDIKINNQSVFNSYNNQKFNLINQSLKIAPHDKNIEINFSSLNYTFPNKIKFAYKLVGVDDDWIYTSNDRQFAIYNNLKKGKYTFLIKATDENGIWSNQINSFKIYKRPAFYETWWAYSIYFILIFLLSYSIYKVIKNRIKLRNDLRIAQIEKEKSEELTQTKLRYFTNISHDFLTPLTIMSCLIDDAEITYNNKIPHFDSLRTNISRLKRLLQQVLDFRKVESGNMKLKISYGDIVPFIHDICYDNFSPLIKKKNISFTFDTSQEQIFAYFDADKIDKSIYNLLSNAFKYSNQNGVVKVTLKQENKNNHSYLTIIISDTGIGIDKKELKDIFNRFYTNQKGEKNETNGIGLSLTKELIELHHGQISVQSELNKGTTFSITIPIDKNSYNQSELENILPVYTKNISLENIQPNQQEPIVTDTEKDKPDKNIKLLIVEDNEELLSVMERIFSKNYIVLTAKNGVEAIEKIRKENDIDIIISDVMMPEMDGLELTKTLKKDIETSHIPIILLTAKNSTEDRIECYNAGANGYIAKPFEIKILEARINNFLTNKAEKEKEFKRNADFNISSLKYQFADEEMLKTAIKTIEEELTNPDLNVISLSEKMHMSKSSFYRKIKSMTGLSPNEFIRNVRLKHACQMLKNTNISVAEVAYATGFSDPKYFSVCFKNEFGITPTDYQKQESKKES